MSTSNIPEYLNFRSDKYFYQMLITFFSSIVGLRAIIDKTNPMGIKQNERLPIKGKVHAQFSINSYDLFKQYSCGSIDSSILTANLCCMTINTAYETVKDKNNRSPEFEFFRHIRNASSHGNKFYFHNNQPNILASWRGKSIDNNLRGQNNPLFGKICFFDFLGPADIILLLWDIEQII